MLLPCSQIGDRVLPQEIEFEVAQGDVLGGAAGALGKTEEDAFQLIMIACFEQKRIVGVLDGFLYQGTPCGESGPKIFKLGQNPKESDRQVWKSRP